MPLFAALARGRFPMSLRRSFERSHPVGFRACSMEKNIGKPETCLVCGDACFEGVFDVLLRCRRCGFVTARQDDDVVQPRTLYEGDYFTGGEYLDYLSDEQLFRRNFRSRIDHLRRYVPSGRLLEIGSAYGFFLDEARRFFDGIGFEINPDAVDHARGRLQLDVRTDDFLAAKESDIGGPVDVAVLWDVIEHLDRPDLVIEQLADLLKPGALLCLTTGDIGSALARIRGRHWRMIHPPTHLHYFNRATIARLLTRCGYDVIDIRTVGMARSFRQILYSVLAIGLHAPRAYIAASSIVPAGWGVTVNTFDIMQVTARRRST